MSRRRDKPSSKASRLANNTKVKPSLGYRLWRLAVEHPRGVLVAAATLLGLIVVLGNWRPTRAKLLIWEPELPFIVWAMIFMLVGYLTGKWIEWAILQRRIRKGTYKPRATAEDLADTAASLNEKLPATDDDDDGDPATIIDRSGQAKVPQDSSDAPVKQVDYWDEAEGRTDDRPSDRLEARDLPSRSRSRSGDYSKAADQGSGPAPSRYRDDRPGDGGGGGGGRYNDYSDYADYQDGGGRPTDGDRRPDSGSRRGGGRYSDYSDYADYQDGGSRRGGGRRR
jgi:uncharacterized integral membrane protein